MTDRRLYRLSAAELAQILYCMECMASDYRDGTPDAEDFESALAALQTPVTD